jgi:uncharacterized protein (DUF1697 family)
MPVQVAMLRGINVGRARRIAMPALRDALAEAGLPGARTYVQSGNVLIDSRLSPTSLATEVEAVLAGRFGFDDVPVLVRTRAELRSIVTLDPLRALVTEDKRYQVGFMSGELSADVEARLMSEELAPEAMFIDGREIYTWHPDGVHNSKLAKLLVDRKLGVTLTARNWTTVTTLLTLMT